MQTQKEIGEMTINELLKKTWCYDCTPEEWEAFIFLRDNGEIVEINVEMFNYWMEVLPPVYMNKRQEIKLNNGEIKNVFCSFGFAEGLEHIVDFWFYDGKYYCKKSNRMNQL
jgi:hypothetical protein